MLEVVVPISLHIGCNNIYTFGWDGVNEKGEYNHFYQKLKRKSDNVLANKQEYYLISFLDKEVFTKNNINIYKCNNVSPINLRFKEILL